MCDWKRAAKVHKNHGFLCTFGKKIRADVTFAFLCLPRCVYHTRSQVSRQLPRTGVDNNRRNSRTNGLEHLRTVLVAYEKTITLTLPSSP